MRTMHFNFGKADLLCFQNEDGKLGKDEIEAIDGFLKSRSWIYDGHFHHQFNGFILYRYHGFTSMPFKTDEPVEQYKEFIGTYDIETEELRKLIGRNDITIAKFHVGYISMQ